jgi:hypothetical protein
MYSPRVHDKRGSGRDRELRGQKREGACSVITTHRYFLDRQNGMDWNLIILDQSGSNCTLFISGDNGKYVARFYYEKDFREFLLGIDKDYLLDRIAKQDIYDGDDTKDKIKRYILDARYDGGLNREEARKEWDLIEDYDIDHEIGFHYWLGDTTIDWEDATDLMQRRYSSGAVAFVERVLPRLKQLIAQGLEKEVHIA